MDFKAVLIQYGSRSDTDLRWINGLGIDHDVMAAR